MRKSKGMFDGMFDYIDHAIPDDDFDHVEHPSCQCQPYMDSIGNVGRAWMHRQITLTIPDSLPEGFC